MTLTTKITIACGLLLVVFALSFAAALAEIQYLAMLGVGFTLFLGVWCVVLLYALSNGISKMFATK